MCAGRFGSFVGACVVILLFGRIGWNRGSSRGIRGMDGQNMHKRSTCGRHSIDGDVVEGGMSFGGAPYDHGRMDGVHGQSPENWQVPTLRVQTGGSACSDRGMSTRHGYGLGNGHGYVASHGALRWAHSPRFEQEPSWIGQKLARLLLSVGITYGSSSPRRKIKVKHSDANLVQLGLESAARESLVGVRAAFYLRGLAKIFATILVGLATIKLLLYKGPALVNNKLWCSAVKAKKKVLADEEGFMTPYEPYSRAHAMLQFAQPSVVDGRQGQYMCATTLKFEQIGLLFLTHERVRNEAAWRRWFTGARGRIPLGRGRMGRCLRDMEVLEDYVDLAGCRADPEETNPISSQFLFDVWVHLKKGEDRGMFRGSIFESSLIPDEYRIDATWGGHSLIDATRVLFAASLANPLVSKMILVSDSDVPLYGPLMMYNQLMSEKKSRVNACNTTEGWDRNEYRLRYDFIERGISWETWRKSWQWVGLERRHAHLVVQDTEIDSIFRLLCRARWDHDWCDFRVCYSDEHYIPTLLAMHGLDNETDCTGELTDKDWSRVKSTDAHPWEYKVKEISEVLFEKLRHPELVGCERSMLIQSGLSGHFTTAERLIAKASRTDAAKANRGEPVDVCKLARDATYNRMPSYVPLGSRCPLLARKFSHETADVVEALSGWIFGEE